MPDGPQQIHARLSHILTTWETLSSETIIAGMSLHEFREAIRPSLDARTLADDLATQLRAALTTRDNSDQQTQIVLRRIVAGVKAHADLGDDSALYKAFGYVRRSERRSGLVRVGSKAAR